MEPEEEEVLVFVYDFVRQVVADTIKIKVKVGNQEIAVLVDTRSTPNFLDQMTTKILKCELECTNSLRVIVANGRKLECNTRCPKLD